MKRFCFYPRRSEGPRWNEQLMLEVEGHKFPVASVQCQVPCGTHHNEWKKRLEVRGHLTAVEIKDFGELGKVAYIT